LTSESTVFLLGPVRTRIVRKSSLWVKRMSYARIQPYLLSIVLALAAIPLALRAEAGLALGALILALASMIHTRSLLQNGAAVVREPPQAEEQDCRTQVFSSVDELSAGIAHEINNPLAIIAQETEWLQHLFQTNALEDLRQSDDCQDCLREIAHQVDRCKEIVKKLLSLARQMNPVIQDVDINSVLRTLISLAQRDASEKNVEIIGILDPDLPSISSDPPLLRQVFLNLLVNATQAIEAPGRIVVTSKKLGADSVEISIQDNGCGISAEHLSKIFTPFFTTKPEGKGTGLGLAICRGIVERLGGTISVTSNPGSCTTFMVRLPIHSRTREGDTQDDV
jgi:two-component system, NtrC family, sensor kinase